MKILAYIFLFATLATASQAKPVKGRLSFKENVKPEQVKKWTPEEWIEKVNRDLKRGRQIHSLWGGYPDFQTWYLSRPWIT